MDVLRLDLDTKRRAALELSGRCGRKCGVDVLRLDLDTKRRAALELSGRCGGSVNGVWGGFAETGSRQAKSGS